MSKQKNVSSSNTFGGMQIWTKKDKNANHIDDELEKSSSDKSDNDSNDETESNNEKDNDESNE